MVVVGRESRWVGGRWEVEEEGFSPRGVCVCDEDGSLVVVQPR